MTESYAPKAINSEIQPKMFTEQVKLLYKHLLLSVTTSFICYTLIFFGLYCSDTHPATGLLVGWFMAVMLVALLRVATYFLYQMKLFNDKNSLIIFLVGMTLSAILWAILGSLLMPTKDVLQQALVIIIIAGVTAGGAQSLQANLKASVAFVSIIIVPLCIWLYAQQDMMHVILGVAMTAYLVFMVITSLRNYQILMQVMSLHYANAALVDNLSTSNKKLFASYKMLEQHEGELTNINKLNYLLQSCKDLSESYEVMSFIAKQLFADFNGSLSILNPQTNEMEITAQWGGGCHLKSNFKLDDCLGLRFGKEYHVNDLSKGLICSHFAKSPLSYICLPLLTHNKITGVMTLCTDKKNVINNYTIQLAMSFIEVVQLSFANISLRESLYDQSIHDALTGVFNRRYLDVILNVELNRAINNSNSFCVVMMDLDNFKTINDAHGHGAGDEILKSIGKKLESQFRKGDIAFRYGGDEFLIILGNSTLADAVKRMQLFKQEIENSKIYVDDTLLPTITVSIGIAEAPLQGITAKDILHSADQALYLCKQSGRNIVVSTNSEIKTSD